MMGIYDEVKPAVDEMIREIKAAFDDGSVDASEGWEVFKDFCMVVRSLLESIESEDDRREALIQAVTDLWNEVLEDVVEKLAVRVMPRIGKFIAGFVCDAIETAIPSGIGALYDLLFKDGTPDVPIWETDPADRPGGEHA